MSVFIGSISNTQEDDISLAKDILNKQVSVKGSKKLLTEQLQRQFETTPFLFNRGRESLYFFLNLLNLKADDEVITQAFTCVAVIAPILWAKAKPVYVDIDIDLFNMDINQLEKKLNQKTRVVIVQHTFGNIVNIEKVKELVQEKNRGRKESEKIHIIEDCAHIYVKNNKDYDIGKYSDAYFFSFSQDKIISSTQGAALFVSNEKLFEKAKEKYNELEDITSEEERYVVRYIILWDRIKRMYFKKIIPFTNITIGRILIIIYRFFGLIKKQASLDTLTFIQSKKMSDTQACLLLNQLKKLSVLNENRRKVVNNYSTLLRCDFKYSTNNNMLLRYPVLIGNRGDVKQKLKEKGIIGGVWYSSPVFPLTEKLDLENCHYTTGSCPNVEKVSKYIFNLPTNIEVDENISKDIIEIINTFAKPVNF